MPDSLRTELPCKERGITTKKILRRSKMWPILLVHEMDIGLWTMIAITSRQATTQSIAPISQTG